MICDSATCRKEATGACGSIDRAIAGVDGRCVRMQSKAAAPPSSLLDIDAQVRCCNRSIRDMQMGSGSGSRGRSYRSRSELHSEP